MKKLIRDLGIIVIGSIIAGIGISVAINAGYGSATLAILWQGMGIKLNLSLGAASIVTSILMLTFVFFYDISQIKIGTVVFQLLYSIAIDISNHYVHIVTGNPIINFLIMVLGLCTLSFGIGLYSATDRGRGPYEAVCFAITKKQGWQLKYVRIVADVSCVVLGWFMGGSAGVCTVMTILMVGPLVQRTVKFFNPSLLTKPA